MSTEIGLTTLVFIKLMKIITLLGGKKYLQYHMTGKNLPTDLFTFQVIYKYMEYWQ